MRIIINQQQCVGCGLCEELLPEVFIMQNQRAKVKRINLNTIPAVQLRQVAADCPAEAIDFIETDDDESSE